MYMAKKKKNISENDRTEPISRWRHNLEVQGYTRSAYLPLKWQSREKCPNLPHWKHSPLLPTPVDLCTVDVDNWTWIMLPMKSVLSSWVTASWHSVSVAMCFKKSTKGPICWNENRVSERISRVRLEYRMMIIVEQQSFWSMQSMVCLIAKPSIHLLTGKNPCNEWQKLCCSQVVMKLFPRDLRLLSFAWGRVLYPDRITIQSVTTKFANCFQSFLYCGHVLQQTIQNH